MRKLLENKSEKISGPFSWSAFIRDRTCSAMLRIWRECSAVKESTGYDVYNNIILLLHTLLFYLIIYKFYLPNQFSLLRS